MRSTSLLAAVALLTLCMGLSHAEDMKRPVCTGPNLSKLIDHTSPWPEYGGNCPPLFWQWSHYQVQRDTPAVVSFSGKEKRGWIRAGEEVYYTVDCREADGEWRKMVRIYRCGNPATGRYWHEYKDKGSNTLTILTTMPVERTVAVSAPYPVEHTRTVFQKEYETVEVPAQPFMPPPNISGGVMPVLAPIPMGYTNRGAWRTIIQATVGGINRDDNPGCKPPGSNPCRPYPGPGPHATVPGAGNTGNPGSPPPGNEVGGTGNGPGTPDAHGDSGAATGGSGNVTPATQ